MKSIKVLATLVLFSSTSLLATVRYHEELPKNCHRVKNLSYYKCLKAQRLGAKIKCGDKRNATKIVCDEIGTKDQLEAMIEPQEDKTIFKCLKSIATNKKAMDIIPVGNEADEKFEIKDNSLTADQSKKAHVLVDAKTRRVQKCKFEGESKKCVRASWSDLKKVLKENIALTKVDPFKPVKDKYAKKKILLEQKKADLIAKEGFINSMSEADGEGIKKHIDSLNGENKEEEKIKWKKIFAEKLGVSENDFSDLSKLKAVKKDKIAQALRELKDKSKEKLDQLPADEAIDKELYKEKMKKVSESSKRGKKLCHDIGFDSLVTEIKNKSGSNESASREAASSEGR